MNIEKIKQLVEFDTPTVANGLEMLQVRDPSAGYTGPDIRALTPEFGPRVGMAVTARLDTTSPGTNEPPGLFSDWLRLMQETARGDGTEAVPVFAVIESVGPRPRHTVTIGDMMATLMKLAGAVGFLTNGSIRDIEGIRRVPLACWGAGLASMHGRLRWLDVNSPVVIDGVTIRPGDFVHADINGAIVIPPEVADQVCDEALEVRQQEQALQAEWHKPGTTLDALLADQ